MHLLKIHMVLGPRATVIAILIAGVLTAGGIAASQIVGQTSGPMAEAITGDVDGAVLVATVERGGPAERAGLQPGDVVRTFNGETIDNPEEFVRLVSSTAPNATVTLSVVRDKSPRDVKIALGQLTFVLGSRNGQRVFLVIGRPG